MKTLIKSGIVSMLIALVVPFVNAQYNNTGSYTGTIKEGTMTFTICNKTISGTCKSDWGFGTPKTIDVSLKGDGIDIQTNTTSTEDVSGYVSQRIDVFSGTVNGKAVSGNFTKTYLAGFKGTVKIGDKTITPDKTYLNYVLDYSGLSITCKRKVGVKQKFNMVWGGKNIDGTVNSKVNLGKNTLTSEYAFTSGEMSDEEIGLWLFLFVSSEIFSGR